MPGPLEGLRVVELAGLGPAPFAAMLLADLGADVLRISRPDEDAAAAAADLLNRGKHSVTIDLKSEAGRDAVLAHAAAADVLLEGFRPGVGERLGIGAERCLELNPRLVYGRMSGWGREGELATAVGHDINFIAAAGLLSQVGSDPDGPPVPPLALAGDFGGGAMSLVVGILAALWERERSGRGQVVDASIIDGASILMTVLWGFRASGQWNDARGENLIDGSDPFYGVYRTADGGYLSVGALEPQFQATLLDLLGLTGEPVFAGADRDAQRARFAEVFLTRSRDAWSELLEGTDACVMPVLSMGEAPQHPHNVARNAFVTVDGIVQPAPTPRFGRTATATPTLMRTGDHP